MTIDNLKSNIQEMINDGYDFDGALEHPDTQEDIIRVIYALNGHDLDNMNDDWEPAEEVYDEYYKDIESQLKQHFINE